MQHVKSLQCGLIKKNREVKEGVIKSQETFLTGLSAGSMKKILICISNSPQPDSFTSYGGFVTTA